MVLENLILITIDALRADHVSCLGYHKKTTPRLDELAKNGVLFTQAFANGVDTSTSFCSILTSTYPLMFDYQNLPHLSKRRLTLAEVLKGEGYLTAAFHCNPILSGFHGHNRGFFTFNDWRIKERWADNEKRKSVFVRIKSLVPQKLKDRILYKLLLAIYANVRKLIRDPVREKLNTGIKLYVDANTINTEAENWLRTASQRFFLWIHYMDAHIPYMPPQKYLNDFGLVLTHREIKALNEKIYRKALNKPVSISKKELDRIIGLYDATIRNIDDALGSLIDKIKEMGLLDNTLVVITADHGDEFLEHGGMTHVTKGHIPNPYDELIHVPLMLYSQELDGIKVKNLISLLDLAPTILYFLGIKKPDQWLGENVLPLIRANEKNLDRCVISEVVLPNGRITSYRTMHWKFIQTNEANKEIYELYNLEQDPNESHNLVDDLPILVNEFTSKINEHILAEKRMTQQAEKNMTRDKIYRLKLSKRI